MWDLINYDLAPNHISAKGCPTPTYQYYVTRTGRVYKIAQEAYVTWHAGVNALIRALYHIPDWNQVAVAICFAHDPDTEDGLTEEQIEVGTLLATEISLRRHTQASDVLGHRELEGTGYAPGNPKKLRKTCPGKGVDLAAFREAVKGLKLQVMAGKLVIEVKIARG